MSATAEKIFGPSKFRSLEAGVPVLLLAIVFSGVIYNRNLWLVPDQSYLQVFFWQLLSWLPWFGLFPIIKRRLESNSDAFWQWTVASFIAAFTTTLWFIGISQFMSPYVDQPLTMFGLYKWWLIFWFALSFFLFWAGVGFMLILMREKQAPVSGSYDHQRLAIWQSGSQIIINKEHIVWVGAEDYYARIVLQEGNRHWIRTRLTQLIRQLSDENFVQVHRSAIANIRHLVAVARHEDGYWEAVMSNDERIRVSRAGKARLEEAISIIK